jgi:hypothetical protein
MATKLGIELPPDLLEAARITQAANRNKLSIRDQQNRVGKKIVKAVEIIKEDVIDPRKGGVPEYVPPELVLPKAGGIPFGWVIFESNRHEVDSINSTLDWTCLKEFEYQLSSTNKARYFNDALIKIMKEINFAGPGETSPDPIIANLSGTDITSQSAQPLYFDITKDSAYVLNFLLAKTIQGRLHSHDNFSDEKIIEIESESSGYLMNVFLFANIPTGKDVYLYVVYKASGEATFDIQFTYQYSYSPTIYSGFLSRSNSAARAQIYDLTKIKLVSGRDLSSSEKNLDLFAITPFGDVLKHIQTIDPENLPSYLKGVVTLAYKIPPQAQNEIGIELSFGSQRLVRNVDDPGAIIQADMFTYTEQSSLMLNENLLFTFSTKNYANI